MAPSVFDFRDYRKFLHAYYEREKESSQLSFALFAKRAGLKSPNYLKLVMGGARNLTQKNIFLFAKAMQLSETETAFFVNLVQWNQSQCSEERAFYQKRLSEFVTTRNRRKSLEPNIVASSWHYPICAVIAHGKKPEEALQILYEKYGVKKREAHKILQNLIQYKVLSANEAGPLTLSGSFFTASKNGGMNLSQEIYLQDQIKVSLREFPRSYRNGRGKYVAHTMTTSPEGVHILKSKFLELLEKESEFFDSLPDGDQSLVQVNVQIFEIQKGAIQN